MGSVNPSKVDLTTHYLLVKQGESGAEFKAIEKGLLGSLKVWWASATGGWNPKIQDVADTITQKVIPHLGETDKAELKQHLEAFQTRRGGQAKYNHVFDTTIDLLTPQPTTTSTRERSTTPPLQSPPRGASQAAAAAPPLKSRSEENIHFNALIRDKSDIERGAVEKTVDELLGPGKYSRLFSGSEIMSLNEFQQVNNYMRNREKLDALADQHERYGYASKEAFREPLLQAVTDHYGEERAEEIATGKAAITDAEIPELAKKIQQPAAPSAQSTRKSSALAKGAAAPAPTGIASKQEALRKADLSSVIVQVERDLGNISQTKVEREAMRSNIERAVSAYTKEKPSAYAQKKLAGAANMDDFLYNLVLEQVVNNTAALSKQSEALIQAHRKA